MGRYTAGFKIIIFLNAVLSKVFKLSEQETYVCFLLFFYYPLSFPHSYLLLKDLLFHEVERVTVDKESDL